MAFSLFAKPKETFYGYYVDGQEGPKLAGAISFEREGSIVTICRMMVHPDFFRRGIASSLLQHILIEQEREGATRFIVSTGSANSPAIRLYEGFGFIVTTRIYGSSWCQSDNIRTPCYRPIASLALYFIEGFNLI